MPPDIPVTIVTSYLPGAIGRIAELHGTYYAAHWNFGAFFEAKVATEFSAFIRDYQPDRDGLWLTVAGGRVEGGIVIDGARAADEGAHLRWFIASDPLRGKGTGKQLLQKAMKFCQEKGFPSVYLWTFEGLHAARHLYESVGFEMTCQRRGVQWGTCVNEQRFEWRPQFKESGLIRE
ncbi:GNAT family N-acetyltransferase [Desulfosarcina sp. OttesenSCG-928-A07]|nr:GNAT family N-acetyltransferase [Desulfosarcina sp. OttesenSCG-928-G17]MDL2328167.1 GNAT family N-acetyltransferase [Desulfosarcina sp. OttesenSCG-928-A07]